MDNINIEELILSKFIEPTWFVNYRIIDRSSLSSLETLNDLTHPCRKIENLSCWKLKNLWLMTIMEENIGILFDGESYIVEWNYDIKNEETPPLVYHWKGQHALKGYSPLPSDLNEHCPVERIVQWSEPAIFFHAFQKFIVFAGDEDEFDRYRPHLLLARGELLDEIHFVEVPCKKVNLRSRASFLLIIPEKRCFLYWHGAQTSHKHQQMVVNECQPHNHLKKWQDRWSDYLIHEIEEGKETNIFSDTVEGSDLDFIHISLTTSYSPKLFYLNSITGSFTATEVEYPLRAQNVVAPFPFLQSHLYTADQPAFFLLDNNTEIWLWKGPKQPHTVNAIFTDELKLAEEFQKKYAQKKEKIIGQTVTCFCTGAHEEPMEFQNIFPTWVENLKC